MCIYLPQSDVTSLLSSHRDEKPEDEAGPFTHAQDLLPWGHFKDNSGVFSSRGSEGWFGTKHSDAPSNPSSQRLWDGSPGVSTVVVTSCLPSASVSIPKPRFPLWDWENPIFPHGWG